MQQTLPHQTPTPSQKITSPPILRTDYKAARPEQSYREILQTEVLNSQESSGKTARRLFKIHSAYVQETLKQPPGTIQCFQHIVQDTACAIANYIELNNHNISVKKPDFDILRPFFLGQSTDLIEATFKCSSQYGA